MDGGFGVGKTHLLVSIYKQFSGSKLFGSFLTFTSLVGALGFAEAMRLLSKYQLICIDEFEDLEEVVVLECHQEHIFHLECLEEWI